MIKYDMQQLNIDPNVTFEAIPDKKFDTVMEELDKDLNSKMLQNKIQENESNQEAINIGNFTAGKEKVSQKTYKETLIETIEQFLPMPYEKFKKLDLDEQQRIINDIKLKQGKEEKDMFQERFDLEFGTKEMTKHLEEERKRFKGLIKRKDFKLLTTSFRDYD